MTPVKQDDDYNDFDTLPVDDAHRMDDVVDDDVAVTEEDNNNVYEEYEKTARKKRQAIFNLVLGLMVLFGAIIAYLTFFKTDNATPAITPLTANPATATQDAPLAATTAANGATDNVAAVVASPATGNALPPGVITPQDMVNATMAVAPSSNPILPVAEPDVDDNPIQPVAAASTPVDGTMAEALPPPVALVPAAIVEPVAVTPVAAVTPAVATAPTGTMPSSVPAIMPVTGETPMVPMTTQPQAVATIPAPQVAVPPITVPVVENTVSEQRMQQMEQQVQQLTAELNAAKAGLVAGPVAADSGTDSHAMLDQLRDLNGKFDRVTKQVDDLDQRTTGLATAMQNPVGRPAVSPMETAVETKKPVQHKARVEKAAPKASATKWELRSAKPGEAWLGKLGTDEMARFSVGQTVPGLGVVQEVTQENNRWIIKASNGTLRQ